MFVITRRAVIIIFIFNIGITPCYWVWVLWIKRVFYTFYFLERGRVQEFILAKKDRQTKIFFQKPNKKRSLELLNRSRKDLAMLVMCCTGHNFLRKYRFLQKRIAVRKCRLCEYEEESSLHIIAHCPAFELPRIRSFFNQELDLTQIDLDQLSCFIRDTKIGRMLTLEEIQI